MVTKTCRAILPLAVCALGACSSGGGGDSNAPPAITPTADKVLLPLVTAAGELQTFDPANPSAAPVTVDTGVSTASTKMRRLTGGRFKDAGFALEDGHFAGVVYISQGQLKRLSLLKGADPAPVRFSSLTDACRIRFRAPDYANTIASRLLVETAGPDADCAATADNAATWLRVDASTLDVGQPVSPTQFSPREALYAADGSLIALLGVAGPSTARVLTRYDIDLQNPVTVANLASGTDADVTGPRFTRTKSYLRMQVDGEASACLYRYDGSANALSPCLHPFAGAAAGPFGILSEADTTHVYFADGEQALRVGHAEAAASPLFNGGPDYQITDLWLSAHRVVVNGLDQVSTQYSLRTISRAPTSPLDPPVPGISVTSDFPLLVHEVAGNWVYYTDDRSDGSLATRALEDGSRSATAVYADWGGFSQSTARVNLGLTLRYQNAFHGVLGVADPVTYDVGVTAMAAQSGESLQAMGSVYGATASISAAYGRYRLAEITVYRPGTGTFDADVYFVDTLTGGSLRPVAATEGQNDKVVR